MPQYLIIITNINVIIINIIIAARSLALRLTLASLHRCILIIYHDC